MTMTRAALALACLLLAACSSGRGSRSHRPVDALLQMRVGTPWGVAWVEYPQGCDAQEAPIAAAIGRAYVEAGEQLGRDANALSLDGLTIELLAPGFGLCAGRYPVAGPDALACGTRFAVGSYDHAAQRITAVCDYQHQTPPHQRTTYASPGLIDHELMHRFAAQLYGTGGECYRLQGHEPGYDLLCEQR